MISAAFAGLGGSLYAHYLDGGQPADVPDVLFRRRCSSSCSAAVRERSRASCSAACCSSAVSEALRVAPEVRMIAYGLCCSALVFWFPKGFAPLIDRFWHDRRLRQRQGGGEMTEAYPSSNLRPAQDPTARCARSKASDMSQSRRDLGLIGPNGSGKSTFFDCCTGLHKSTRAGEARRSGHHRLAAEPHRTRGPHAAPFQKTVVFRALDMRGEPRALRARCSPFRTSGRPSDRRHGASAASRRCGERARELIKIAGLSGVASPARRETCPAASRS